MINAFFNDLSLDGAELWFGDESESDSQISESDADTSSEGGSIDLFNMAELNPAFTDNAYAIFVTDVVRSYALQGRYDDALEFGNAELSRLNNARPELSQGLEFTLSETEAVRRMDPDQLQELRAQTPSLRVDGPSFKHDSLFAKFDNALTQPDPSLEPTPAPAPAPAPGHGMSGPASSGPSFGGMGMAA